MFVVKILEVHPLDDYIIRLTFSDGVSGEIDLSHLVGKGVLHILKSIREFQECIYC